MNGLCAGAPGIGLARLQMLQYVDDSAICQICRQDVDRVRSYLAHRMRPLRRDTLCCGNAAQIEAEWALTGGIARTQMHQPPVLYHPLATNDFVAGLFQGWAGVGYALTRCLPGARSSLFVWEVKV